MEVFQNYEDQEIDMYLDLHAHTGLLGTFVYGNSYTDVYRFQRHSLFPKHLSYCAPDFSLEHTAYNKDRNKQGTSRRFLSSFLDEKVNCYTLEVSFHGYEVPKGNSSTAIHVYDEAEYLRLGESICHSLLDYYCATKYIPPEEVPPSVRESCCKGSRANKLQQQQQSSNQSSSPHHVAAASGMTGNVKKSATAKGKAAKTKPAATSKTSEEPHAQKPKVASAKNV
ncbi:hypothetical protein JTE90_011829 [Oedothorax gibbosus]|uniref:Uncharacterized protein n=1 Tax=Oedothorax gibbosus TaxID=931172 RepID=A0AAV6VRV0_9ARAC|nr:hypothetical protein JTE90_011829 [Oedothorax gibbosus]